MVLRQTIEQAERIALYLFFTDRIYMVICLGRRGGALINANCKREMFRVVPGGLLQPIQF
jgi:hypothetical protein